MIAYWQQIGLGKLDYKTITPEAIERIFKNTTTKKNIT